MAVRLTARQADVLRLLAKGYVYKQIAVELGIEVSTVRSHANGLYEALGVYNGAAAVAAVAGGVHVEQVVRPRIERAHGVRTEASKLATEAPLLYAYLRLWEESGCPLDPSVVPQRRRHAMHVLLAMHVGLGDE